ncbi:LytR/AlgR family response regulator transcription factor [Pseudopontixanthobacter vadosimaris]|uniref:LytR/AlgR family response regulator transcription factor n=1 Tax=Pseudopontixanthobacter vadosimaris TaxID=2726450 RepID=UPI00147631D1|nr:LytTR family DNA-binding domain-containing protein [Pseudopontixanthobacter vadosimaris]
MAARDEGQRLRTLIVDDEPLAVERLRIICERIGGIDIVGDAADGAEALDRMVEFAPDLVLLDMTMPQLGGLDVARHLAGEKRKQTGAQVPAAPPPAIVFVTAHDRFAVEAFDLDAVDYVLKPVSAERLERAVARTIARRSEMPRGAAQDESGESWLQELWVPNRSELLRIDIAQVARIDAERDYVRLHVGTTSYLLLKTIAGLEERLNPRDFIRIHRSTILRRDTIRGLRHDGLGVWSVELDNGDDLRIGRTYLPGVKAMAGR